MTPNLMPRKGTPSRTSTRLRVLVRCDYCSSPHCFDSVTTTERVRVLRPLSLRNPAMADALSVAGLTRKA